MSRRIISGREWGLPPPPGAGAKTLPDLAFLTLMLLLNVDSATVEVR